MATPWEDVKAKRHAPLAEKHRRRQAMRVALSGRGIAHADIEQFPHCDDTVLHAPGVCAYCDRHPDWQAACTAAHLPFSPLEANGWSGIVAVKAGQQHTHMGATFIVPAPEVTRPTLRTKLGRAWAAFRQP